MKHLMKSLLALTCMGFTLPVMAGLMSHTFGGDGPDGLNDCKGYFGDSFDACQIFGYGEDGSEVQISPVIAKYEMSDDEEPFDVVDIEINSEFSSFDGSEVTINENGTWSYDPGENDPGIRYWSAKAGTKFNLFWYVSTEDEAKCGDNPYTLECLNFAQSVTGGDWFTPDDKGLSHLVVYDSEPPKLVPEPATAALLLTGVIGLVLSRRRKFPV